MLIITGGALAKYDKREYQESCPDFKKKWFVEIWRACSFLS
jgi:hypothetical protein